MPGLAQGAVDRLQVWDRRAGSRGDRSAFDDVGDEAVGQADGVGAAGDREQDADVGLERGDQWCDPGSLGRAQGRGHDLVQLCGEAAPAVASGGSRAEGEADVVVALGRDPGELDPTERLGVAGVGQERDDQLLVEPPEVAVAVAVVQPMERQRRGGSFGYGDEALWRTGR